MRAYGATKGLSPDEGARPDERYLDGPRLRTRRKALGLSQSQLARQLGVEANTVARWEQGNRPIANPVMVDLALQTLETQAARR